MALGMATSGLAKLPRARTTPRPEFCIPTSMATVRATVSRPSTALPARYPNRKPQACRLNTARRSRGPASSICSRPPPTTEATIRVMVMTATSGAIGSNDAIARGKRHLSRAPTTTGRITTCSVSRNSPVADTATRLPTNSVVKVGVISAASKVDSAVIVTDSATSALAR